VCGVSLGTSLCLTLRAACGCAKRLPAVLSPWESRSSPGFKSKTPVSARCWSFFMGGSRSCVSLRPRHTKPRVYKPAIVLWGFARAIPGSRPLGSLWLCKTALLSFCPHVRGVGHRRVLNRKLQYPQGVRRQLG